ncbi:unnamed protein product [Acanthosepion pharaonis]|uniref:Partner and localiser of BRCA2 WD40 domain-containing protein n=1 Tax=Acanthosepion pharaonis TaxID=158019 RepID=A0A812CBJ6_ACAPH|nr:unnamed protein product [Sepia pharaonis]
MDKKELLQQLMHMKKEYAKKCKRLQLAMRAKNAREHVRKKIEEHNELTTDEGSLQDEYCNESANSTISNLIIYPFPSAVHYLSPSVPYLFIPTSSLSITDSSLFIHPHQFIIYHCQFLIYSSPSLHYLSLSFPSSVRYLSPSVPYISIAVSSFSIHHHQFIISQFIIYPFPTFIVYLLPSVHYPIHCHPFIILYIAIRSLSYLLPSVHYPIHCHPFIILSIAIRSLSYPLPSVHCPIHCHPFIVLSVAIRSLSYPLPFVHRPIRCHSFIVLSVAIRSLSCPLPSVHYPSIAIRSLSLCYHLFVILSIAIRSLSYPLPSVHCPSVAIRSLSIRCHPFIVHPLPSVHCPSIAIRSLCIHCHPFIMYPMQDLLVCVTQCSIYFWKLTKVAQWEIVHRQQITELEQCCHASLHPLQKGIGVATVLVSTEGQSQLVLHIFQIQEDMGKNHSLPVILPQIHKLIFSSLSSCSMAVARTSSDKTIDICKYSFSENLTSVESILTLDFLSEKLLSLSAVQGLPAALLGFTTTNIIFIWNHIANVLLTKISLCDIMVKSCRLPSAFTEQGHIVFPLIFDDGPEQGCLLAVNPNTDVVIKLLSYQRHLLPESKSDSKMALILNENLLSEIKQFARFLQKWRELECAVQGTGTRIYQ